MDRHRVRREPRGKQITPVPPLFYFFCIAEVFIYPLPPASSMIEFDVLEHVQEI